MFKILIPAVAALGLIAFAAKTQPMAEAASSPVEHSSQAGLGWHVSHEGAMAKLAYGVANSDQLAMMVTCAPGDSTAAVYGDVRPTVTAAVALSPMDETRIAVKDSPLRSLVEDGRISVHGEGGVHRVSATAVERRAIAEFLGYCARKQA